MQSMLEVTSDSARDVPIMMNFMLEEPNRLRFKMGSVWKCAVRSRVLL